MMRKTQVYQLRISSQDKQQAFAVFEELGITPAQAIRLLFKHVIATQSLPVELAPRMSQPDQNQIR